MELDSSEIITNEELDKLECPTYEKQIKKWNDLLNSINEEKIKALVKSVGYNYVDSQLIKENKEFKNNPFYIINVTQNNSQKQLILRILDPHPFFKRKKTTNEVSIINYLKDNTNIPVPSVISFSKNKSTSLIGCEYILINRIKGKFLGEEFKNANEIPDKVINQMLNIFKELKSIKFSTIIGCFDDSLSICTTPWNHGPIEYASESYLDYINKILTWSIKEMNKINKYKQIAKDLEVFQDILIQICKENENLNNLNFYDEMSLVHNDLNSWNILIDPITFEITGILNWESSYYGKF
jgi:aminoglycoside phosphotransferase (APT) family kinase protein